MAAGFRPHERRATTAASAFSSEQKPRSAMRGSPRSVMLAWANTVVGWWTSAAVSALQRQQRAMLASMTPKPKRKPRRKRAKSA